MRLKSGIPGFDELIEGGFPDPSITLIYGEPGSGKSVFSLQYLMYGAAQGEKGVYITTLSEKFRWMVKFMSGFEFFNPEYFEKGVLVYDDMQSKIGGDETAMLGYVRELIAREMPRRLVIDSITPLAGYVGNYREFLFNLVDMLKKWDISVIFTAEMKNSVHEEEMYMADGIVELLLRDEGDYMRRYIKIRKMRGTNHSLSVHPLAIDSRGISVLKANY
ncbi:MAG: KaiA-binding protein [Euryarchaeota archaeon]|nr:KaiA-binding protein [Euryarchaeota archaeon]